MSARHVYRTLDILISKRSSSQYFSRLFSIKCEKDQVKSSAGQQVLQVCQRRTKTAQVTRTTKAYPVISDVDIDRNDSLYLRNQAASKQREGILTKLLTVAEGGGGEKAIERHTKRNKKLLVKDRLRLLFDEDDDYLELSPIAGIGMEYGDVPKAGVVTAIGKIMGRHCLVIANDATVKAGTVYPVTLKKNLRAQEIAEQNRLPCIYVVDSGGAFLPLQAQIFNPGGQTFYNEAIMSSKQIPQVAIVCGSCTAGGAYIPTMADEAVIVNKLGTIFLGGPPLVQAATGEIVTADELGGATLHCSISGCTDYFATDEYEAFQMGRDIIASLNLAPPPRPTVEPEDPLYDPADLSGLVPADSQQIDMYKVIARIVDGSRFREFKKMFGPSLLTGFAYICGHLAGILANQGELTETASIKGSHFVQLCSERHIPLVFLQNTVPDTFVRVEGGNIGGLLSEQLKAQAKMFATVSCAAIPKITVIVGSGLGASHYIMGGRAVSPNFLYTWPNAVTGLMEPDSLARILSQETAATQSQSSESESNSLYTKLNKQFTQQMSALFTSTRVLDDGVILPKDTRKVLGQTLSIVQAYKPLTPTDYPIIRM